uniref:HEAT repeat-containing protein 5B n=1 Tax=Macrostomum lignano TaxID=282301 RepID=A0A1I8F3U2_9PLAT
ARPDAHSAHPGGNHIQKLSPAGKSSDCKRVVRLPVDTCWCPLLQGMARLCCDNRKPVRMQALTYLQRSLLFHDLRSLYARPIEAIRESLKNMLLVIGQNACILRQSRLWDLTWHRIGAFLPS